MPSFRNKLNPRDGCGYILVTAVFTCVMLVLNTSLVMDFYQKLSGTSIDFVRGQKFKQFFLFTMPIFLVFVEWYVFDWVVYLLTPSRPTQSDADAKDTP